MKKKGIILVTMLLVGISMQAVVYHLEKVNKIVSGEKYVLVENYLALDANGSAASGLTAKLVDCTKSISKTNESYIWTAQEFSTDLGKYRLSSCVATPLIIDANGNLDVLPDISAAGAKWEFDFSPTDSTAQIKTTKSSTTYYCYYTGKVFKAKKTQPSAAFTIYRLMPDSYERVVGSTNLGTICLPFAVEKHDGVDVYQIAYKELDANMQPSKLYYQLVEGQMEAGRPYIFVPKQAGELTFTTVQGTYVDKPMVPEDGFHGTFAGISDGASLEGKYMINGNSQFQLCGTGCSLGANRAYIVMNEVPEKEDVPAPTRRVMVIGEQSEPTYYDPQPGVGTGIDNPVGSSRAIKSMHQGQLRIRVGDKQYNMLGQQL